MVCEYLYLYSSFAIFSVEGIFACLADGREAHHHSNGYTPTSGWKNYRHVITVDTCSRLSFIQTLSHIYRCHYRLYDTRISVAVVVSIGKLTVSAWMH
jgi:hypothetical protein